MTFPCRTLMGTIATAFPLAVLPLQSHGECIDYTQTVRTEGRVAIPGYGRDIVRGGDYVYVADAFKGLNVVDVSDPAAPELVTTFDTPGRSRGLQIAGDRIFLADREGGLRIIDVSTPGAPMTRGVWPSPEWSLGVALVGDLAYVAQRAGGLQVIDVSSPDFPSLVGQTSTLLLAFKVAVQGSTAYVMALTPSALNGNIEIFDVSNPSTPVPLGVVQLPDDVFTEWRGIAAGDDVVYVSSSNLGLVIVDVSDPNAPSIASSLNLASGGDLALQGSTAYVAGESGLSFIDVADPADPVLMGTYPGNFSSLTIDGTQVVTANNSQLCETLDLRDEQLVFPLAINLGFASCLSLQFPYAYVAGSDLRVVDISNPLSLWTVGIVDFVTTANAIARAGDFIYVANGDLRVYDISVPNSPTFAGATSTPGTAKDLVVRDELGFVADGLFGLRIVNVGAPPAAPTIGSVQIPGFAGSVALSGNLAFLAAAHEGLRVVDVSNPATPVEVGFVDTPVDAVDVDVRGSLAAVADDTGGVHLIDVSVPTDPVIMSTLPTTHTATTVTLAGDLLYFGGGSNQKLTIVDVADPENPIVLGRPSPLQTPANDFVVANDIVYVAAANGLVLYPAHCVTATSAPVVTEVATTPGLRIVPNPVAANGARFVFAAPVSSRATLTIHDVAGRRIRTITAPAGSASDERAVFWEGRDEAGRAVAPGVYFVRLERAGQNAEVEKLTLLR